MIVAGGGVGGGYRRGLTQHPVCWQLEKTVWESARSPLGNSHRTEYSLEAVPPWLMKDSP